MFQSAGRACGALEQREIRAADRVGGFAGSNFNRLLALQREQFALARSQLDRAERINARAEALQDRAGRSLRVIALIALPLVLLFMLWPYLRHLLV